MYPLYQESLWSPPPGYVPPIFTLKLKRFPGVSLHYRAAYYTQSTILLFQELYHTTLQDHVAAHANVGVIFATPDGPVWLTSAEFKTTLRKERKAAREAGMAAIKAKLANTQYVLFHHL